MLFIIPAFMLCLMFTNLQPRFLIAIYQNLAGNNFNIRQIICRFNLIHYGSLFLIYPFILITNFNWVFFITMSCILFPQIYTNGFINIRPDLSSVYYTHYIMSRFILIVPFYIFSSTLSVSLTTYSDSNLTMLWAPFVSSSFLSKYNLSHLVRSALHTKDIRIEKGPPKFPT